MNSILTSGVHLNAPTGNRLSVVKLILTKYYVTFQFCEVSVIPASPLYSGRVGNLTSIYLLSDSRQAGMTAALAPTSRR